MQNKRNITWRVRVLSVAILLVLGACATEDGNDGNANNAGDEPAEDAVIVNMAVFETDPNGMMEEARQRFNAHHDDIQLEFVRMSNDGTEMHSQTVTQLTAGAQNLDIVNLDVVWTAEFAQAQWLDPLDDRFTEEMQEDFIERQVDAVTYDDQLWAVPWFNDLHPLWYRQDLLDEYGFEVPDTYEEAIEIAQTIQEEEGIRGFSMHWGRSEQLVVSFTEFLHANGGEFFDEDGNVIINSPEAVEALQFMVDMIDEYEVVSPSALGHTTPDDSRIPFTEGQALFSPNWGYVYEINQAEGSPVQDRTWLTSNFAFEDGRKASSVGGWNLAISTHSQNKEEAWDVIEWFTSFDNQKEMLLGGGFAGTQLALYEDEEVIEANPHLEEYLEVFEDGSVRPSHPQYAQISDITQSYVHRALSGDLTPEEAMERLASDLEAMN